MDKAGKVFKGNKVAILNCFKPEGRATKDLPGHFCVYIVDLSVEIRIKASVIKNEHYSYRKFIMLVL